MASQQQEEGRDGQDWLRYFSQGNAHEQTTVCSSFLALCPVAIPVNLDHHPSRVVLRDCAFHSEKEKMVVNPGMVLDIFYLSRTVANISNPNI